jgi:hypothetical protein
MTSVAPGMVAQPVGPPAAEELVSGAPDDEGRDLQAGQGGFDRQQVAGAQGRDQALELAGRFRGAEPRFQPGAHDVVGQAGDVLVAAAVDVRPGSEKSWSAAAGVCPCSGRSKATQRRWPSIWSMTCRHS